MSQYEALYIIKPTVEEEERNALMEKFSALVTGAAGQVVKVEPWGRRRLAYLIDDFSEGFYVLMNFESEPDFPKELERNFRINDQIIRYMIINTNE